jgi:hypothetical protein
MKRVMCDCALGTIDPRPQAAPLAGGTSGLWKFAAIRQSLRLALRALRVRRTSHAHAGVASRA